MRHAAVFLWAAFVWLLAPAAAVRAEFIPWQYNWSRSPAIVPADAPGTGYIKLTDESLHSASGDSDIVATNLNVVSTAPPNHPDVFTNKPYTLTLFLLDTTSSHSGTLAFTGELSGTASSLSSHIRTTFTGDTTQELILGQSRFTVTIGPFTPPGPPDSSNKGAISAFAQVSVTNIQKTPEPSTLLLACIGVSCAGCGVWRRRRARRACRK
ncbi:MAG: PEP-CTERM sorting domain-containing protein [Planctomycetes bacterium]|nr:PEP-CTERM sorting domain-containing protein [Planctomycetota bacterium]